MKKNWMVGVGSGTIHNGTKHRARTDIWIQNSRLFPDFFQSNNFIFQTHGYQIHVGEKTQEQSFFHDALQTYWQD